MADNFMKPELVDGFWWEVETNDGIEFIPGELYTNPSVAESDIYDQENELFQELLEGLKDYIQGREPYEIRLLKGWGCRLSAPGYMDCTEWSVFDTQEEAEEYLKETYPEDEEDEGE